VPVHCYFAVRRWKLTSAVCRKVYNEASAILYGSNTFFIECGEKINRFDYPNSLNSPIFRYHRESNQLRGNRSISAINIEKYPVVKKVKNWKFLISVAKVRWSGPQPREILAIECRQQPGANISNCENWKKLTFAWSREHP
jgi:hypothetical protein